jgi:hypothetical protein
MPSICMSVNEQRPASESGLYKDFARNGWLSAWWRALA